MSVPGDYAIGGFRSVTLPFARFALADVTQGFRCGGCRRRWADTEQAARTHGDTCPFCGDPRTRRTA